MKKLVAAAATLVLALGIAAVAAADNGQHQEENGAVTYAVIGDTPYGTAQIANFPNDVAEINADPNVSLVMHLGDIKNGSTRCDTSYFQLIRSDFDRFADPLVYTPGDNEWTDCHRANNGGYTPTERLAKLRQLFFDLPGQTLGDRSMHVAAQAAPYVENVAWSAADVQFGTLDVPGSNNDWLPWFGTTPQSQAQVDEFTGRNAADIEWLDHIFDAAKKHDADAVVLGLQADMWDPAFSGANDNPSQYDHFTAFVQALAKEVHAFHKPVLLLNGDSHQFTDDHPLADTGKAYQLTMYGLTKPVPNLRRITVNGSTTPCHEWLKLTVDPASDAVFSYQRIKFHNQPGFTGC
jgi:hypothetical protein